MRKFKSELEQDISAVLSNFLHEQLGERAVSVKTFLSGNVFTVRADSCLAPGELVLLQSKENWQLLQEVKMRQFQEVQPLLKQQLEELTGCTILNIHSMVGQDGIRFEFFTLSENLENKLLKQKVKEAAP